MRKIILVLCTFFVSVTLASAQDNRLGPGTGNFVIGVDAAYYPKTDKVAGDTHFAPLTGAYSAFELRGTGTYNYVIPVPFSNHPLLRGNKVNDSNHSHHLFNPCHRAGPLTYCYQPPQQLCKACIFIQNQMEDQRG